MKKRAAVMADGSAPTTQGVALREASAARAPSATPLPAPPSTSSLSPKSRAALKTFLAGAAVSTENRPRADREETAAQPAVLFDAELDGIRCVLMKIQPRDQGGLPLSPRESEIGRLIAKGYVNKQVAAILEISVWTVSAHLRRMFAKLHVSSRAALVAQMTEARLGPVGLPTARCPRFESCRPDSSPGGVDCPWHLGMLERAPTPTR